jgi:hypothetical protein
LKTPEDSLTNAVVTIQMSIPTQYPHNIHNPHISTINVPVVYMEQKVMILMRAKPFFEGQWNFGRGWPLKRATHANTSTQPFVQNS